MDAKNAQVLALLVALLGMLVLYYWPQDERYERVSIARAAIMDDGNLVLVQGKISAITNKSAGWSARVCEGERCISAYIKEGVAGDSGADWAKLNSQIKVWGEISAIYSNKFISAHKIEIED